MDLLSIVVKPTWREFLTELIESNEMNPLEVNLIEVAEKYLQKIRDLQSLDLRVPANVILASAILLRFKAEALRFEEEVMQEEPDVPMLIQEDLPDLVFNPRLPRARSVTLDELIRAVEGVLKDGDKIRRVPIIRPGPLELNIAELDMNSLMKDVLEKANALKDAENILLFSNLAEKSGQHLTFYLLPVLHLAQEEKLSVWQDEIFGEVFLKVVDEAHPIEFPQAQEAS
jgi:segregation and condensation protein A